jgi:dephospho-CoA kinase
MTKIVGLTGGIEGTTTNHFKSHGVPVYIADEARKIMESQTIIAEIKKSLWH